MRLSLKDLVWKTACTSLVVGGMTFGNISAMAQNAPKPAQQTPTAAGAKPTPSAPAQPQQPQQPPGPLRLELQAAQGEWMKVCGTPPGGKEVCFTTRDFTQAQDQPPVLALAVYESKAEEQRSVRLLLPVGLLLKPGFRYSIDKGSIQEGSYEVCVPNGCFASSEVKLPLIEQLKKGTVLNVSVRDQGNNDVTFVVPLSGFGKAFDGPAIDPKVLEAQQKALEEQLQKGVEEERKRLESSQPPAVSKPANGASPAPGKK